MIAFYQECNRYAICPMGSTFLRASLIKQQLFCKFRFWFYGCCFIKKTLNESIT